MNKPAEILKTKSGKRLEIWHDDSPESPRTWDNVGTMAIFHKCYRFGDEVLFSSDDFQGWDEMENYITDTLGAKVCLPIFMYDHSGVTIKTGPFSCGWDSGKVGFIYATEEKITETWGECTPATIQLATQRLEGEVETMDQYLQGEVYGFKLIKPSLLDDPELDAEEDSCWGFFGSDLKTNGILDHLCTEDHPVETKS